MLPFGVTIPATVPQRSEIPEGLKNNPVYVYVCIYIYTHTVTQVVTTRDIKSLSFYFIKTVVTGI